MFRIDSSGNVAGLFTDGDPSIGQPATVVSDEWLNAIQEEIANIIENDGTLLDKLDSGQLVAVLAKRGGLDAGGNFTPAIGGSGGQSGQTYSNQSGVWHRQGKLVHFRIDLALTAKGTITGNVQIQGMPFAAVGSNPFAVIWHALAVNKVIVMARMLDATSVLEVFGNNAADGSVLNAPLVTADLNNTSAFQISGCYITDDPIP